MPLLTEIMQCCLPKLFPLYLQSIPNNRVITTSKKIEDIIRKKIKTNADSNVGIYQTNHLQCKRLYVEEISRDLKAHINQHKRYMHLGTRYSYLVFHLNDIASNFDFINYNLNIKDHMTLRREYIKT